MQSGTSRRGRRVRPRSRAEGRHPLPDFVTPQLATLVDSAPAGDDWFHEIKYDGYRLLARLDHGDVRLITRRGNDWTERYPEVADALAGLPADGALLDGEVVVVLPDGTTSFQALQNAGGAAVRGALQYVAFDLLHLDGRDVSGLPLEERKALLEVLTGGVDDAVVRYSAHVEGNGPAFFTQACGLGLEGIISKRREAPYRPGRGREWLKVKCLQEQEFVITGYTRPKGARTGFGALLLAVHDERGALVSVGKVGTGFDERSLASLHRLLRSLEQEDSPLAVPPRGAAARDVHWVRPVLVAEVAFTAFTADGNLRHPTFRGLREDKPAAEVRLESPAPLLSPEEDMPKARKKGGRVEVAGVSLSSPDKVLYHEQGVTKLDIARYYEAIAEWILPHIENRPLTLVRCPSGYGECFYQKHIDQSAHEAIRRVSIPGDPQPYGAVNSLPGLVALVQLGVLELHTWGARRDRVERPDRIVLDLDPDPSVPWERVVNAAFELREALSILELESFVKTTGGKGLHVVVPFRRGPDWDQVKAFSRGVAEVVAGASPGAYTLNISKARRKGRILIDYLRNGQGATAIEAYSTRARAGAPVAVPLSWDELGPDVREDHYNIATVPERLAGLAADPWKEYAAVKQSLTAAVRRKVGSL